MEMEFVLYKPEKCCASCSKWIHLLGTEFGHCTELSTDRNPIVYCPSNLTPNTLHTRSDFSCVFHVFR